MMTRKWWVSEKARLSCVTWQDPSVRRTEPTEQLNLEIYESHNRTTPEAPQIPLDTV